MERCLIEGYQTDLLFKFFNFRYRSSQEGDVGGGRVADEVIILYSCCQRGQPRTYWEWFEAGPGPGPHQHTTQH